MPAARSDAGATASLPPPALSATSDSANPEFRWPARGRVIQGFGSGGNDGINIAVPEGTQVKAAESGVVAYAGSELKGYGNLVLIRHPNGFVSAYANNGSINVKRGDTVKRGQTIALSGQSGNVASPQLHFELRKGSKPVDPSNIWRGSSNSFPEPRDTAEKARGRRGPKKGPRRPFHWFGRSVEPDDAHVRSGGGGRGVFGAHDQRLRISQHRTERRNPDSRARSRQAAFLVPRQRGAQIFATRAARRQGGAGQRGLRSVGARERIAAQRADQWFQEQMRRTPRPRSDCREGRSPASGRYGRGSGVFPASS